MRTTDAFIHLISQRGSYKLLGVADSTVRTWRMQLVTKTKKGSPSISLMEEMLDRAGYRVIQEKLWRESED